MKRFVIFALLLTVSLSSLAQTLTTNDTLVNQAFELAVWTIDHNTHNQILEAGAGYGGEWTRDCAMNSWNAASMLRPKVAENSLWSVTIDSLTIGHQYWDKIVWTIAAYNHYLVTGDEAFLDMAYPCAKNTMEELEKQCFDTVSGLFMGPAVFQDGIAGYDEPVYDPQKWDDSFVLHHPNSSTIKCLSTNLLYYQSYRVLAEMALLKEPGMVSEFNEKTESLKAKIRVTFYRPEEHKFYYLIDHLGHPHDYQEGLGLAFVMLFDVVSEDEAADIVHNTYVSKHGLPCIYPSFPRNTPDKPGRHNMMVWPHVNMYFASGCAHQKQYDAFYFELYNLVDLAMNRGKGDFYEIYTIEGEPSGGYQCGALWDKKEHQTWCATGFIRLFLNHIFGLTPASDGLELHPIGMKDGLECRLDDIRYRNSKLSVKIKGHGETVRSCRINGVETEPFIPADAEGDVTVEVVLE